MSAADDLAPAMRAATWRTLIGLLAVTGMRQGEACRLERGDIDLEAGTLVIAGSKFGKSRQVFLHPTAAAALRAYERDRDRAFPGPRAATFFVNSRGGPLDGHNIQHTFAALTAAAGIQAPPGRRAPRLHDLRHMFTVATTLGWYRDAGTCRPASRCCPPGSATSTRSPPTGTSRKARELHQTGGKSQVA